MRTRLWLNIGLLLALALLAWLALREPGRVAEQEPVELVGLPVADIQHLSLTREGDETVRLYRAGEHWYLDHDPPLPAQASLVRQLLRLAREPVLRQYEAHGLDLERLGLGGAAHGVRFNDNIDLRFGGTEPLDGLRYVQRDARVYLIRDHYQYLVAGNPDQWISPRLLPEGVTVHSLELPSLALRRDTAGHWQAQPEQADLPSDALIGLVEGWRHATALRVQRTGLREPGLFVRIGLDGADHPLEFQVRQVGDDWRFLRTDLGLEYRLDDHMARRLLQPSSRDTTQ